MTIHAKKSVIVSRGKHWEVCNRKALPHQGLRQDLPKEVTFVLVLKEKCVMG